MPRPTANSELSYENLQKAEAGDSLAGGRSKRSLRRGERAQFPWLEQAPGWGEMVEGGGRGSGGTLAVPGVWNDV